MSAERPDYQRLLGDCPTCGRPGCHGRRCSACAQRRAEPQDDPGEAPWGPPGGSYRNVAWTPNWNPLR